MDPPQTTRTSRKKQIPRTFILNWQYQGSKPRRPLTACEACRTSKIKCSGQQRCDRCTTRGISCRYTPASSANLKLSQQNTCRTSTDTLSSLTQTPAEEMSIYMDVEALDPSCLDSMAFEQVPGAVVDWPIDMANQRVDDFDYTPLDSNINGPTFDNLSPTDLNHFQSLIETTLQHPSHTTPLLHTSSQSSSSTSTSLPSSPPLKTQLSLGSCQCRANLMLPVPKVKSVMEEIPAPQLHKVFEVTEEVIRNCQNIIYCRSCQISCTDLICIMAVFQQTDICFKYITKVDLASAIKVSLGEHEVLIFNDIKLRYILVIDLVKKANVVLGSLSHLGQNLFLSQPVSGYSNQINLDYLQEMIENFKRFLRSIMKSFDEAGFDTVVMARGKGSCNETDIAPETLTMLIPGSLENLIVD